MNPLDLRTPSVDDEEVARWGLSNEDANRLSRLNRSDLGGDRVEDARGLAGRQASRWGRVRIETAEARRLRRADREDHPVRCDGASVDQRDAAVHGRFVQEEPRLEIVGPIDDRIDVGQNLPYGSGVDIARDRLHADRGVHALKPSRGGLRLRRFDVRLGVQGLSLQVHEFDHITVDEAHATDPGSDQQVGRHAPEGAQADDRDAGRAKGPLALRPNFREDGLSAISIRPSHSGLTRPRHMAFVHRTPRSNVTQGE